MANWSGRFNSYEDRKCKPSCCGGGLTCLLIALTYALVSIGLAGISDFKNLNTDIISFISVSCGLVIIIGLLLIVKVIFKLSYWQSIKKASKNFTLCVRLPKSIRDRNRTNIESTNTANGLNMPTDIEGNSQGSNLSAVNSNPTVRITLQERTPEIFTISSETTQQNQQLSPDNETIDYAENQLCETTREQAVLNSGRSRSPSASTSRVMSSSSDNTWFRPPSPEDSSDEDLSDKLPSYDNLYATSANQNDVLFIGETENTSARTSSSRPTDSTWSHPPEDSSYEDLNGNLPSYDTLYATSADHYGIFCVDETGSMMDTCMTSKIKWLDPSLSSTEDIYTSSHPTDTVETSIMQNHDAPFCLFFHETV